LLTRILETVTVGLKQATTGSDRRSIEIMAVESYGSIDCSTLHSWWVSSVKGVVTCCPGCNVLGDVGGVAPSEYLTFSVAFIAVKRVLKVGDCPASPRQVHETLPRSGSTITVSSCFVLSGAAEVAEGGEATEVGIGVVEEVGVAGCTVTVRVHAMAPSSTARTMA
jgi:hypothetical protein